MAWRYSRVQAVQLDLVCSSTSLGPKLCLFFNFLTGLGLLISDLRDEQNGKRMSIPPTTFIDGRAFCWYPVFVCDSYSLRSEPQRSEPKCNSLAHNCIPPTRTALLSYLNPSLSLSALLSPPTTIPEEEEEEEEGEDLSDERNVHGFRSRHVDEVATTLGSCVAFYAAVWRCSCAW